MSEEDKVKGQRNADLDKIKQVPTENVIYKDM